MQIGTAGGAYGPGFQMSRPTLGAGQPLKVGSSKDGGGGFIRRNRVMPMLPKGFDIGVHHNELANRVAALQIARHPILAGTAGGPSPLMAAHAARGAAPTPTQSPVPTPPPLQALPEADAGSYDIHALPVTVGPAVLQMGSPPRSAVVDRLKRAALARGHGVRGIGA